MESPLLGSQFPGPSAGCDCQCVGSVSDNLRTSALSHVMHRIWSAIGCPLVGCPSRTGGNRNGRGFRPRKSYRSRKVRYAIISMSQGDDPSQAPHPAEAALCSVSGQSEKGIQACRIQNLWCCPSSIRVPPLAPATESQCVVHVKVLP